MNCQVILNKYAPIAQLDRATVRGAVRSGDSKSLSGVPPTTVLVSSIDLKYEFETDSN